MMLAENVVELTIASQLEFIDLVTTLTDNITHMIGFDDESAYWVNMAVRESVANAVEHGNKYDPQKPVDIRFTIGVDALRVTVRDQRVQVRVADTGVGLRSRRGDSAGTGLSNLRERLVLAFGDDACVRLGSTAAEGTVAEAEFPARRGGPA